MKHLHCCKKKDTSNDLSPEQKQSLDKCFDVQNRVLELFIDADITAYDLATICNVPRSTVSRWLNTNCQMTVQSVERFCKAMDISLSEFFSESTQLKNESEDIKKLRLCWKHLSKDEKSQVLDFIDFIISRHKFE